MNILVLLRMVPDVVEELEIAPDGKALDEDSLRMILSESDDHALETALILKERHGGSITVLAPDAPEVDEALFTALAKGADRALKLQAEAGLSTAALARSLADTLRSLPPADLILTGVQSYGDFDGLIAPLIAHWLELPHAGIVTKVTANPGGRSVKVLKEYAGGVHGEFEAPLPAVLGIQAAEKAPRYVPVAKVRAAMKSAKIEPLALAVMADGGLPVAEVLGMAKPVATGHAEMLEGDPEEVAGKLVELLVARGLL